MLRILENTVVGDERQTQGISFISGIGYPIAIPMLLFTLAFRQNLRPMQIRAGYCLFALYGLYVIASGSRYVLVGPILLAVLAVVVAQDGLKLTWSRCIGTCFASAFIFGFLTYGTVQRDVLFGAATPEEALAAAPGRKLFVPSNDFMRWFHVQPRLVQNAVYGAIDIAWYQTHGMAEFRKVWDYADPNDKSWGAAQFATGLYFLRLVGLNVPSEEVWRRNLPTYGFYTGFFGLVYLDFGIFLGIVYCGVLGVLAQLLWRSVLERRLLGVMFYPFTASVILNAANNNLIAAGLGVPIIGVTGIACSIVWLCLPRTRTFAMPSVARRAEFPATGA